MIKVGCAFRAGLMLSLWQHQEAYDVFEHSLDAFVGAGDDGLRAVGRTCAEMSEFTLHAIGLSLGSESITERAQFLAEISAVLKVMEATEFSDHVSFCRVDDVRMHDFAPVWRDRGATGPLRAQCGLRPGPAGGAAVGGERGHPLRAPGGDRGGRVLQRDRPADQAAGSSSTSPTS